MYLQLHNYISVRKSVRDCFSSSKQNVPLSLLFSKLLDLNDRKLLMGWKSGK